MLKKSLAVSVIFIISTFIQLVSQIVVTRMFGAKLDLDIFLAAVAVPTITVTVIYGTLNDAFLPLLGEKKIKNPHLTDSYFFSNLFLLAILSLIITWVLTFFTTPISHWLYQSRGVEFVKNVAFQMNYLFYAFPLSVIATLLGAYFYVHKKFNRFPFAQAVGSAVNLLLIILLAPYFGILSLVFAFVINIMFQIFLVIPTDLISNFKFNFFIGVWSVRWRMEFGNLLLTWLPLMIGSFAIRSDSLIIRSFGTQMPTGYLVYLNLIAKIFSLATGVTTIGIQITLLPHLVEFLAQKEFAQALRAVKRAKFMAIGISLVITIITALLSPFFIKLLFIGGKFTAPDARISISLLPFFIMPAVGWGVSGVFFQPLIALKKTWTVCLISILSLTVGWISANFINIYFGPIAAITAGLIIVIFGGIIGSELLWQYYQRKLS